MISKSKLGIVIGSLLGLWHLAWALLVATGLAQWLIDWVFRLHFIRPPYAVTSFNLWVAVALVAVTSVIGYVAGWLTGAVWNRLHDPA